MCKWNRLFRRLTVHKTRFNFQCDRESTEVTATLDAETMKENTEMQNLVTAVRQFEDSYKEVSKYTVPLYVYFFVRLLLLLLQPCPIPEKR